VNWLSFFDTGKVAQNNDANIAGIKVLREAKGAILKTK
jgi:hypothetical protein